VLPAYASEQAGGGPGSLTFWTGPSTAGAPPLFTFSLHVIHRLLLSIRHTKARMLSVPFSTERLTRGSPLDPGGTAPGLHNRLALSGSPYLVS